MVKVDKVGHELSERERESYADLNVKVVQSAAFSMLKKALIALGIIGMILCILLHFVEAGYPLEKSLPIAVVAYVGLILFYWLMSCIGKVNIKRQGQFVHMKEVFYISLPIGREIMCCRTQVRWVGKDKVMEKEVSKYMSLILRHKPEVIGITLDEHGWANVSEFVEGISRTHFLDMEMLEKIVNSDEKQRYSFNEDKSLIRANQGHSIPVDVELEVVSPPEILWHGTGDKYTNSIQNMGLIPKSRLYVHLSQDYATAVNVGARHGIPIVYKVLAKEMEKDGYVFYKSVNGVWLTKEVPAKYLEQVEDMTKEQILKKMNGA